MFPASFFSEGEILFIHDKIGFGRLIIDWLIKRQMAVSEQPSKAGFGPEIDRPENLPYRFVYVI